MYYFSQCFPTITLRAAFAPRGGQQQDGRAPLLGLGRGKGRRRRRRRGQSRTARGCGRPVQGFVLPVKQLFIDREVKGIVFKANIESYLRFDVSAVVVYI